MTIHKLDSNLPLVETLRVRNGTVTTFIHALHIHPAGITSRGFWCGFLERCWSLYYSPALPPLGFGLWRG